MGIKVTNEVHVCDYKIGDEPKLKILSDWHLNNRITLEIDGKKYQFWKRDLLTAIENASNANNY